MNIYLKPTEYKRFFNIHNRNKDSSDFEKGEDQGLILQRVYELITKLFLLYIKINFCFLILI